MLVLEVRGRQNPPLGGLPRFHLGDLLPSSRCGGGGEGNKEEPEGQGAHEEERARLQTSAMTTSRWHYVLVKFCLNLLKFVQISMHIDIFF
jgi:hypothetical protein